MPTMASLNFRLPTIGLTLFVVATSYGFAHAEKQTDPSLSGATQSYAARQYSVGDQVPSSVKFDDDGFPDRPYAILIVDGAIVFVIDRRTRRVVEVLR